MESPAVRDLPWRRIAGVAAGAGVVVVVLLGLLVRIEPTDGIDGRWMAEVLEMRGPGWEAVSRVFDFLGGGWFAFWFVPVAAAVCFLIARRPWAALAFVSISGVSAASVQVLKFLFGRARPTDILLDLDTGSYPSGHVANAATIAVLLALLLQRWSVAIAGAMYVTLMALSRTYLGAHWVTDTVGGALLGASIALAGWAILEPRLHRERQEASPRGTPGR